MISSTDSIVVPLSADVTTANVQDNQVYQGLTFRLPSTILKKIHYMVADHGYDDNDLYDLSISLGFQLVCPVVDTRQPHQKKDFNVDFYESALGQVVYTRREVSP